MSHLQYFTYAGYGKKITDEYHYSSTVRVGNRFEISGQGGWDPNSGEISGNLTAEVDQALANVDLALKQAGSKGWPEVYKITMFYTTDEVLGVWQPLAKKWFPDHRPILTAIGVRALGLPAMHVEIEAVAVEST
ncbi:hypothetical protein JX265_004858 [Neoarthrinium moseri]|uniref:Uncharacterized protein n=1 Tax=Neoarthrinium moseri TaxID=1658444 RepID=A0A9P9WQ54_9PEZI|nr:uncharacterized protein JN550_003639 [Neoarthrinium moseri]KAI1846888.1 hypothetical protein JX266_007109 [Neoarthrinium moseri]KAI1872765.1 hypothetical protein JN550_003639 [Neoarthrinium moseri]KAI1874650.1 hypothetical protein JX265_004858 [Neoarthrinium moseri]